MQRAWTDSIRCNFFDSSNAVSATSFCVNEAVPTCTCAGATLKDVSCSSGVSGICVPTFFCCTTDALSYTNFGIRRRWRYQAQIFLFDGRSIESNVGLSPDREISVHVDANVTHLRRIQTRSGELAQPRAGRKACCRLRGRLLYSDDKRLAGSAARCFCQNFVKILSNFRQILAKFP